MATLDDAPEGIFRALAAGVPPEIMDKLPKWELDARLSDVRALLGAAGELPDESEAASVRRWPC